MVAQIFKVQQAVERYTPRKCSQRFISRHCESPNACRFLSNVADLAWFSVGLTEIAGISCAPRWEKDDFSAVTSVLSGYFILCYAA